jgi:hypothetical protein
MLKVITKFLGDVSDGESTLVDIQWDNGTVYCITLADICIVLRGV